MSVGIATQATAFVVHRRRRDLAQLGARVTQAYVNAVYTEAPEAEATQAFAPVAHKDDPAARVTQGAAVVIHKRLPLATGDVVVACVILC